MKKMPVFWCNALTLYFILQVLRALYLLFYYEDPYPDVPDARGAAHSNISNLFASILTLLFSGYFLKNLFVERQYGMPQEAYAIFRAGLMVYWLIFGVVALAFYLIVSLITEDLYGSEQSISWFFVLVKSIEMVFLWFFLYKVGKGPPIHLQ